MRSKRGAYKRQPTTKCPHPYVGRILPATTKETQTDPMAWNPEPESWEDEGVLHCAGCRRPSIDFCHGDCFEGGSTGNRDEIRRVGPKRRMSNASCNYASEARSAMSAFQMQEGRRGSRASSVISTLRCPQNTAINSSCCSSVCADAFYHGRTAYRAPFAPPATDTNPIAKFFGAWTIEQQILTLLVFCLMILFTGALY